MKNKINLQINDSMTIWGVFVEALIRFLLKPKKLQLTFKQKSLLRQKSDQPLLETSCAAKGEELDGASCRACGKQEYLPAAEREKAHFN